MPSFEIFLDWVKNDEQLLSGLAALIVIGGVVVSPFGHGLRMLIAHRRDRTLPAPGPAGSPPVAAIRSAGVVTDRPSLAVLPFDSMSDERALEFAADGLSEDIIAEMSRDRRLFVVARNSSFAYKGKRPNICDVGRELGVHYVLEGSLRRMGSGLRATAQLIDAQSGAHIWAETLNRDDDDLGRAQDQFGHIIATALTSHFFRDASAETVHANPENLQAWELAARAATRWAAGRDEDSADETLQLLKLAAKLYPENAEIWAQLGSTGAFGWLYDPDVDFNERSLMTRSCIDHALTLAPSNPTVIGAQGAFLIWTGKPKLAVPILRRAMSQLPNEAPLRINLAYALLHSGSPAEARAELNALAGNIPNDMLRGVYDLARADIGISLKNFAEAEAAARDGIAGGGPNAWVWITLALALAAQNKLAEARETLAQALKLMPRFTLEFYDRALRTLYAGDETLSADRLKLMRLILPADTVDPQT